MTDTLPNAPNAARVALIAHDGAQMPAVLGLDDLFQAANRFSRDMGQAEIRWNVLCSPFARVDADFDAIVFPPNLTGARGRDRRQCRPAAFSHLQKSICGTGAGDYRRRFAVPWPPECALAAARTTLCSAAAAL